MACKDPTELWGSGFYPGTWGGLGLFPSNQSSKAYRTIKQLLPARQVKGRFASNSLISHRRPAPEVVTHPELLPIPDPENTVRTEVVEITGDS